MVHNECAQEQAQANILLLGFFISPAIKVTLFQLSLLNMEPDMAEAMAPINAIPPMGSQVPSSAAMPSGFFY